MPLIRCWVTGSIRTYTKDLQDAFKLGVAKEGDFQGASAVSIAQMHLGPQTLAQLVLQACDVGIARQWRDLARLRNGPGFAGQQARDQPFGLSHAQAFLNNPLGGGSLVHLGGQAKNDFSMAYG